jgi:ATP-dependent Clp protease protease subunit
MENKVYRNGRNIFLCGDIEKDTSGEVIMHLLDMVLTDDKNDTRTKDYVREDINLYIKSDGGVLSDAFAIIDIIENSKTPINTIGMGRVASAASLLLVCGNKKYVYKNTEIVIHNCRGGLRNADVERVSEFMENMEYTQNKIDEYYISKTKITQDKLDEVRKTRADWSVYSDEAIKLGIVDKII